MILIHSYLLSFAILLIISKLHFYITKRKYNLENENAFIPFFFLNILACIILLIRFVYQRYFC